MSTILEDPQQAHEALSVMRTSLEDPQQAHETLSVMRKSLRSAVCGQDVAPARPATFHEGRLSKEGEAAALNALERTKDAASLVDIVGLTTRLSRVLHTITIPHTDLAFFVGFLRFYGVLPKEQKYSLDQQAIVQKCAFIAQRAFDLDLTYEYHLHEYGTFSSFLAADYAELVGGKMQMDFGEIMDLKTVPGYRELVEAEGVTPFPTAPFEAGRFISLISEKSVDWLCLASTIVHEKGSCPDDSLLDRVERITANYDKKLGRRVMEALKSSRPPAWERLTSGGPA